MNLFRLAIFSGDPTFTRSEWASPTQFNHCIIAVKITKETEAASVINHPAMDRLLIFDATDQFTQAGDLPDHEQDSMALIAAGDAGDLVKMPILAPETNRMERFTEASLNADGSIGGVIKEHSSGQPAAMERALLRSLPTGEYNKRIEYWISNGINGARISEIKPLDKPLESKFDLEVTFTANSYAQLTRQRLMVFKPALVWRFNALPLADTKRDTPVILDSNAFSEMANIKIPQGFIIDEMPDPMSVETPFGKYSTSYEVKEESLIFKRALTLRAVTIPTKNYNEVRQFFTQIRNAEQTPVVLLKK